MNPFVKSIATLEIPVTLIEQATEWYVKFLGVQIQHESGHDAMLQLPGAPGAPQLYLVAAGDQTERLFFQNGNTGTTHGIIDFYTPELESFHHYLIENGVTVTGIHYFNGSDGFGGFGFSDPDGNHFGATNLDN
ncbi:VOC family protein [Paenibacillus sp. BAC0078]